MTIRVTPSVFEQIEVQAESNGLTINDLATRCLEIGLASLLEGVGARE